VASQVHVGSLQLPGYTETAAEPEGTPRKAAPRKGEPSEELRRRLATRSAEEGSTRQLRAQGVEFVARPGQAEKLQKAIGQARRNAQNTYDGFVGCLVFVSEQEERLVTLVTLWDGTEEAKQRDENSEQVRKLLGPYVDRWLRAGKFVTSVSMPQPLPAGAPSRAAGHTPNRAACN
jgi:hypothetical protein